jgi:alcohol dehydrogenase class IV
MAMASLLGGLCLANAGLGAVHGFAAPVGGMFDAPHGAVCAALLPHVMETNIDALRARSPGSKTLVRYETVARILTGREDARAEDGIEWARRTCERLRILPLRAYGIGEKDVPGVVESAAKASSMKANPIVLTPDELARALARAL